MKKFKHFISLNLLSILSYIFAIFVSYIIFYIYPEAIKESLKNGSTDNFEVTVGIFIWVFVIIGCFLVIETILLFFCFIESHIYKIKQDLYEKFFAKIPDKIKKLHTIMFYIGMIFALIPILLLILFILSAIIDEISIRLLNFIRLLP